MNSSCKSKLLYPFQLGHSVISPQTLMKQAMESTHHSDCAPVDDISCLSLFGQLKLIQHYNEVIMGAIASQITSLTIVYSIVYSDADQRNHQSTASLAFVWGIHRGPVNSPHKWPVTRKMFPFDDVIMCDCLSHLQMISLREVSKCLDI